MRSLINRTRRRRVTGLLALLLLCATAFGVSYSFAHYVENTVDVYATGDADCARLRARVGHGQFGYGGVQSEIGARFAYVVPGVGTFPCAKAFTRPPGYLAARYTYYAWIGGSVRRWAVCANVGYTYNSQYVSNLRVVANFRGSAPCYPGYYLTQAIGYEYNGGWHGGYANSPYHWLP